MTSPTASREDFADELRGFALMGIAVVNAPFLGISSNGYTPAALASTLDRFAALFVVTFAQAKFYVLFAFLFGYSLSFIFKDSGRGDGVPRYRRRLIGLACFGTLHAILFFAGDILMLYAIVGPILLWLRQRTDKFVLNFAYVSLGCWAALLAVIVVLTGLYPDPAAAQQTDMQAIDAGLRSSSVVQASFARLQLWPSALTLILVLNGFSVVALFALGLVAGRRKLLANPNAYPELWHRGSQLGLLLGLPFGTLSAWLTIGSGSHLPGSGVREMFGLACGFLGAPFLTWGYVSWLVILRQRWPNLLAVFRNSGRMSLTGYIGESALLSLIFCGYGLGYFGEMGAAGVLLCAFLVWLAMDLLAMLWQRKFRRGPLEKLLSLWVR